MLATIEKLERPTLGALATAEQIQPPSVTRLVASLVEASLCTRTVDAEDRRSQRVELTPAGRKELARIRKKKTEFLREQIDTSTPMGKAMFTVAAAVAELERELICERVKAGVERAQAAGKHCGRPKNDMDLRAASRLLNQGTSLRQVADMLHQPRTTLRRRLKEAGVVQPGAEAPQSANKEHHEEEQ